MLEKDKWYEHNTGRRPDEVVAEQFVWLRANTGKEFYMMAGSLNWHLCEAHGLWITHYMVPSYVEMMGS